MIENPEQQQRLIQNFPLLADSSPDFRNDFFRNATLMQIPAGHTVASDGNECRRLALVVSGMVRVYKLADSGREITLYRISCGDSCVLTASCIMSDTPFPAIAVTESDVEALLIPSKQVHEWMSESKPWGAFIFSLISKRLADVIAVLEDVAFHRMDERIAAYLIAIAPRGPTVNITHHEIASDLGTTREVVSRILKEFEGKGLVKGARGKLTVADLPGLQVYRR
ncbi:MAG: Crp/Fnr family transcriptional regulator [Gammaproteobacteria bacterium]|nr:Crp/Fnr family transcriptional regulator [Gammaproteobacteria bacterium]